MASNHNLKKYRLATVCTFDYFPFLLVFLGSLFRNVDLDRIESIEILVDKLPNSLDQYLKNFDKIRIHSIRDVIAFDGIHGQGWQDAVEKKLIFCRKLLSSHDSPLILIDSDSMFVGNFSSILESTADILFTYISEESERHVRRDGLRVEFIGSFVLFSNMIQSLQFVDNWIVKISELKNIYRPPYETPALNLLIQEAIKNGSNNYGYVNDRVVSCDQNFHPDTKIVHLKSAGGTSEDGLKNFHARVAKREWSEWLTPANYVDVLAYQEWMIEFLKIRKSSELSRDAEITIG